ncbi:3-beta-hydroxysteroid-Delta(8),Delta(7)-isomerase [Chytridium lagenaria]|nr:3-beta-hydroxysteroid-Delta(8),Delta(7)-isomerase [Chytridium lagenaria]
MTANLTSHPFHPLNYPIPNYAPQAIPMDTILTIFFGAVFAVLAVSWLISSHLSLGTRLVFIWFVCCGFIHGVVEGYFGYNHLSISTQEGFFADLWKEYSKSDSRYMTKDPFVCVMESMTAALWSPFSFLVAFQILNRDPARHLFQFLVSTGQLYGDIAYYLTAAFEGFKHSRPEPLYFWFYFVTLNGFWIVIPLGIMFSSGYQIVKSLRSAEGAKKVKAKKA